MAALDVVHMNKLISLFFAPVDSSWISAVIALAALLVSLISAFKDEIFPFQLNVLCDEVILAPPTAPSHDSAALIFPFVFINNGNGGGVVEALSIKIEGNGTTKIYTPIVEIDFGLYITGKRKLHAESMLGSFSSFTLRGKESKQKHFVFSQEESSKKYPFNSWSEGKYKFKVFVKLSHQDKPIQSVCFERMITREVLDGYKLGSGTSLGGCRELDV
jgi:hypothetical protein